MLKNAGIANVKRCSGNDAYGTAIDLAKWELEQGMSTDKMGVATINGYWDALTGAALCGKNHSVLVLADDYKTQAVDQIMKPNKDSIRSYYIFGGERAVGKQAASACQSIFARTTSAMLRAA